MVPVLLTLDDVSHCQEDSSPDLVHELMVV